MSRNNDGTCKQKKNCLEQKNMQKHLIKTLNEHGKKPLR